MGEKKLHQGTVPPKVPDGRDDLHIWRVVREYIEFAVVDSRQGDGPSALGLGVTHCEMFYMAPDLDRSFGMIETTKIGMRIETRNVRSLFR